MSLSDKRKERYTGDIIEGCKEWYPCYDEEDVEQAIKELKEELSNPRCFDDNPIAVCQSVEETINEIFGDKLSGSSGE